jgi:hypothetical protein
MLRGRGAGDEIARQMNTGPRPTEKLIEPTTRRARLDVLGRCASS